MDANTPVPDGFVRLLVDIPEDLLHDLTAYVAYSELLDETPRDNPRQFFWVEARLDCSDSLAEQWAPRLVQALPNARALIDSLKIDILNHGEMP